MKIPPAIARDGEYFEPAPLSHSTVETIDGFAALTSAIEKARSNYRATFLNKRPPKAFTSKEFADDYNLRAKTGLWEPISHRAVETWLQKWVASGDYQRAPMMLPGSDGIPRRTYVYWAAK